MANFLKSSPEVHGPAGKTGPFIKNLNIRQKGTFGVKEPTTVEAPDSSQVQPARPQVSPTKKSWKGAPAGGTACAKAPRTGRR